MKSLTLSESAGVRPQEDYLLDRRQVEAQQCVELSRTNGRGLVLWCGELGILLKKNYSVEN